MDYNIADMDTASILCAKKSSAALLAKLHYHHDARMFVPKQWTRRAAERAPPKEPWLTIKAKSVKIDEIKRVVCAHFGISHTELLSADRHLKISLARQVGMYLAKNHCSKSYIEISRRFNRVDHTTARWADYKIAGLCKTNWLIAYDVAHIEAAL
jgi:chromosomal replication initiation ATPase DnaA